MKLLKQIILFIPILLFFQAVQAQNQVATPATLLAKAKTNDERLLAYQKIFNQFEFSNEDSALYYTEKGLKEFETNGFAKGKANMTLVLGNVYLMKEKVNDARTKIEEAIALLKKINDQSGLATAYLSVGFIEGQSGNFDKAIHHFYDALKIFEKLKDKGGILKAYVKLGVAYELSGNFDKGLSFYKKALTQSVKDPVSGNLITLYNNIGSLYCRMENYKAAIPYFEKALEITTNNPQFKHLKGYPLLNLGMVNVQLKDTGKALYYLNAALDFTEKEDLKDQEATILLNIAQVTPNPQEALGYLKKTEEIAKVTGDKMMLANLLEVRTGIYEYQKDYKNAYTSFKEFKTVGDSVFNLQKAKEIANLQSVYELEKSKIRVDQLEAAYNRIRLYKNVIIGVAFILAILLFIVSTFLWRIRKLNNEISKSEQALKKANTDKDRLFSIIGHDLRSHVANVPTVLEMYESNALSNEEKTFLLDSLKENALATMDTLDNLLNWGKTQLKGITASPTIFAPKNSVDENLKLMRKAAEHKEITIHNKVPDGIKIYADQEHFKFIIRNLLANAIKYTHHNGAVAINATTGNEYVTFSVKDNGIGMDAIQLQNIFEPFNTSVEGTDHEKGNSLGLMLTKEFIEKCCGKIWVESEKGKGTTFYFTLRKALE